MTVTMPARLRFLQSAARLLLSVFTRLEIHGAERIPRSGPVLLVSNHLHWLDPVIAIALIPRPATMFAADKWERRPFIGQLLHWTQQTIFVARGEVDRRALGEALRVLKSGGMLGIAPEGTRSKTAALQRAHTGAAYLASRTGATLVPVGMAGQETLLRCWKRLRRPHIVAQVGVPFVLPGTPNRAKGEQLEEYTDEIMQHIAALLPPQYRGYYA